MTNTQTICLTILLCWATLMGVVVYAVSDHGETVVTKYVHVEVKGK